MEDKRYDRAENGMNSGDGSLARHAVTCGQQIDWEKEKIIRKEKGWTQRKYLEGIEPLRRKNQGIKPPNNYNQLEEWQFVLFPLFERQNLYMSSSDVGIQYTSISFFLYNFISCNKMGMFTSLFYLSGVL